MCTQCYLVTSKSNKIFMLCIYIQLCTVLRKAKQDDCELLVGLLPPRVREKVKTLSSTNLHVAIFGSCFCLLFRYPANRVSFVEAPLLAGYFSADCEQSLSFFRFSEGLFIYFFSIYIIL